MRGGSGRRKSSSFSTLRASTQTLTNRTTLFPPGTPIVNLFDTNEVLTVTGRARRRRSPWPATVGKDFRRAIADWLPLDPVVVSNSPAHDATNVRPSSPIVLRFSQPMDTNSVQAAFTHNARRERRFAWSAARDTMTFTAGGAGLPGLTGLHRAAHEHGAAPAFTHNAMFAAYELRFKTAAPSDARSDPADVNHQLAGE